MKLYIKQKVFSIGAKFSVKDENGNDKYFVEGEILTLGRKLHIYDINNNEVAFVRQKLLTFMPKFTVEVGGEEIAEIVRQLTLLNLSIMLTACAGTLMASCLPTIMLSLRAMRKSFQSIRHG